MYCGIDGRWNSELGVRTHLSAPSSRRRPLLISRIYPCPPALGSSHLGISCISRVLGDRVSCILRSRLGGAGRRDPATLGDRFWPSSCAAFGEFLSCRVSRGALRLQLRGSATRSYCQCCYQRHKMSKPTNPPIAGNRKGF
jgi:hypothetical protein